MGKVKNLGDAQREDFSSFKKGLLIILVCLLLFSLFSFLHFSPQIKPLSFFSPSLTTLPTKSKHFYLFSDVRYISRKISTRAQAPHGRSRRTSHSPSLSHSCFCSWKNYSLLVGRLFFLQIDREERGMR